MPREQFRGEVEKELTGRETEPHEIIYFKIYKSHVPVIEQVRETAALMLGTDKSRGYCLEMICADRMGTLRFCSSLSSGSSTSCPVRETQTFLERVVTSASSTRSDSGSRD